MEMTDAVGIAPTFSALQTDANLSQLNVQIIWFFDGNDGTRTRDNLIDSQVH